MHPVSLALGLLCKHTHEESIRHSIFLELEYSRKSAQSRKVSYRGELVVEVDELSRVFSHATVSNCDRL